MALGSDLRGKLGFLAPRSVEREIGGVRWTFYAVRVPMVAELLSLSGPIATAVSTLFSNDNASRALKTKQNEVITSDGNRQVITENERPSVSLEMVKHQEEQKKEAIATLTSTLLGPASQDILARFVMDSLRSDFKASPSKDDINEFWNGLDLDVIFQFVAGALEANAQVIRPFLAKAGLNLRAEAMSALREKVGLPGSQPSPTSLSESVTTLPISAEPSSSSSPS
jgi:hypothetical protein